MIKLTEKGWRSLLLPGDFCCHQEEGKRAEREMGEKNLISFWASRGIISNVNGFQVETCIMVGCDFVSGCASCMVLRVQTGTCLSSPTCCGCSPLQCITSSSRLMLDCVSNNIVSVREEIDLIGRLA